MEGSSRFPSPLIKIYIFESWKWSFDVQYLQAFLDYAAYDPEKDAGYDVPVEVQKEIIEMTLPSLRTHMMVFSRQIIKKQWRTNQPQGILKSFCKWGRLISVLI